MSEVPVPSTDAVIFAGPSRDYRWRRWALVLVIFCYGLWSYYDGFHRMPDENAAFKNNPANAGAEKLPHPGFDIPFNQYMGLGLPPLALAFLIWTLYASRGGYRFDGKTISTPGHPNVSVDAIQKIDSRRWDRKGIAYLYYLAPGSTDLAKMTLDDFIYDRTPTDAIYDRLMAMFVDPNAAETTPATGETSSGETPSGETPSGETILSEPANESASPSNSSPL